jgi:dihydrofolate reductase
MKVIIYMAMSANGYIAHDDDDTSFVSDVEWKSFDAMSKRAGNAIIGARTCAVCNEGGQFPFPGRLNVVVSSKSVEHDYGKDVVFVKSPKEALRVLEKRGFKTAFVAGGGMLNASFLKAGLVDEIYLDVEPVVLGQGIKLFADCGAGWRPA